jgi:hypothetical protein
MAHGSQEKGRRLEALGYREEEEGPQAFSLKPSACSFLYAGY